MFLCFEMVVARIGVGEFKISSIRRP